MAAVAVAVVAAVAVVVAVAAVAAAAAVAVAVAVTRSLASLLFSSAPPWAWGELACVIVRGFRKQQPCA